MITDAISDESEEFCEGCKKLKLCRMYILQNGTAAWVCVECRTGVKDAD